MSCTDDLKRDNDLVGAVMHRRGGLVDATRMGRDDVRQALLAELVAARPNFDPTLNPSVQRAIRRAYRTWAWSVCRQSLQGMARAAGMMPELDRQYPVPEPVAEQQTEQLALVNQALADLLAAGAHVMGSQEEGRVLALLAMQQEMDLSDAGMAEWLNESPGAMAALAMTNLRPWRQALAAKERTPRETLRDAKDKLWAMVRGTA